MNNIKEYIHKKRSTLSQSSITTYSSIIKNLYMKVPKALHPVIISIERLPVPLKKEQKIVIDFS